MSTAILLLSYHKINSDLKKNYCSFLTNFLINFLKNLLWWNHLFIIFYSFWFSAIFQITSKFHPLRTFYECFSVKKYSKCHLQTFMKLNWLFFLENSVKTKSAKSDECCKWIESSLQSCKKFWLENSHHHYHHYQIMPTAQILSQHPSLLTFILGRSSR